jgi:ribonuclease P protein component
VGVRVREVHLLTKERRLTENRDFKSVFSYGKTYVHRLLILKVRSKPGERSARWGFSSSSKLGKAVIRNRAKRLVRESVRLLHDRVLQTGYDAVLIARPPIRESQFQEVSEAIGELLHKAGLL